MAFGHLVLAIPAFALLLIFVLIAATSSSSDDSDGMALSLLAGGALAAGAVLAALALGGISLALLGRSFVPIRWSLIMVPGFIGTIVTMPASIIGWPTSELVGAFVAYHMVSRRLAQSSARAAA
jgi:hypothetical protein